MAALLSLEPDIEVVAEVGRGDEVVDAAMASRPDVALLDIEMPGEDGIAAARRLRRALPGCRVLMVTTFGRPGYMRRAMAGGASGFMLKDAPAKGLAIALRRTPAGDRVLDPHLAAQALSVGASPLSPRKSEKMVSASARASIAEAGRR